ARDVQEGPAVELDADVVTTDVHVARDAVDAQRAIDAAVARRRQRLDARGRAGVVVQRLAADVEEPGRDQRGVVAVLPDLIFDGHVARTQLRVHTAGTGQLDRRRDQDRIQRRQLRRGCRREADDGSRAVPPGLVDEVVV